MIPDSAAEKAQPIYLRPASSTDLPGIMAIETESPSPWSTGQLAEELNRRDGWFLLALREEDPEQVVGFACGRILIDEAELLKIAVARSWHRQGIGALLLTASLALLGQRRISRCLLELRASNLAAMKLYTKAGFRQVGRRKNYYRAPDEDALLMTMLLGLEGDKE